MTQSMSVLEHLLSTLSTQKTIQNTSQDPILSTSEELPSLLKALQAREMIAFEYLVHSCFILSPEGLEILEKGSHEAQVYQLLETPKSIKEVQVGCFCFTKRR